MQIERVVYLLWSTKTAFMLLLTIFVTYNAVTMTRKHAFSKRKSKNSKWLYSMTHGLTGMLSIILTFYGWNKIYWTDEYYSNWLHELIYSDASFLHINSDTFQQPLSNLWIVFCVISTSLNTLSSIAFFHEIPASSARLQRLFAYVFGFNLMVCLKGLHYVSNSMIARALVMMVGIMVIIQHSFDLLEIWLVQFNYLKYFKISVEKSSKQNCCPVVYRTPFSNVIWGSFIKLFNPDYSIQKNAVQNVEYREYKDTSLLNAWAGPFSSGTFIISCILSVPVISGIVASCVAVAAAYFERGDSFVGVLLYFTISSMYCVTIFGYSLCLRGELTRKWATIIPTVTGAVLYSDILWAFRVWLF